MISFPDCFFGGLDYAMHLFLQRPYAGSYHSNLHFICLGPASAVTKPTVAAGSQSSKMEID